VWETELYEKANGKSPVMEFLEGLNPKERAKMIREIDLLSEFGPSLVFPHTRKMEGSNNAGLWELRFKMGSNAFRIIYMIEGSEGTMKYVLLHGFRKKTEKTPEKELEKARNRRHARMEGHNELE
jgi:phage-related protein